MRLRTGLALTLTLGLMTPLFADDAMTNPNSGGSANANSGYATDHSNGSTNTGDSTGAQGTRSTKKMRHKRHKKMAKSDTSTGTNAGDTMAAPTSTNQ